MSKKMYELCKKMSKKEMFHSSERINIFYFEKKDKPSNYSFFSDLLEFYRKNNKKVKRKISIKSESEIKNFCTDYAGNLNYENICGFAVILSKTLGVQLPDYIHARIILGFSNKWSKEYIEYISNLRPLLFGLFNLNKKNFTSYLSSNGQLVRWVKK